MCDFIEMASRSSSRRGRDDSLASIPEFPVEEESELDDMVPPTKSIFDPTDQSCESDKPSTSSDSQTRSKVKKSKTTKTTKNSSVVWWFKPRKVKRLSEINENGEDENEQDSESNASFMSQRSDLSTIDSDPEKNNPGSATETEEHSSKSDLQKNMSKKRGETPEDGKKPKSTRKAGANQTTKESSVEPEVSTPGIAARLRKRKGRAEQVETEKENTPPAKRGLRKTLSTVGTQVNPRMLPRTRKVTNQPKTKPKNTEDGSAQSQPVDGNQLDAPKKSRSRKNRCSAASSSSAFPPSSSPLEMISPIPTDSGDSVPFRNDTLDDIPSISDDHQHQPRHPKGSARRSISVEIETEDGSRGINTNTEDSQYCASSVLGLIPRDPPKGEQVSVMHNFRTEPTSSSSCSSKMMKSGGITNIEPSNDSSPLTSNESSQLNNIRGGRRKLTFRILGKLTGRQRRMSSWSSSGSSDDGAAGSLSSSTTTSSDFEESSSTSSSSTPHSKRTCRRCGDCEYCCVCRRK